MKNKKFILGMIFTIICNIVYFLIIIISIMSIFNFKLPNEITKNEFENIISQNTNCNLVEVENKDIQYDVYLQTDDNCPYLINYVYSKNKEDLDKLFNNLSLDALHNNDNLIGKGGIRFMSKYSDYSTTGDYYKSIILNNNTLLYVSVKTEYRTFIMNLFDNYKYYVSINPMGINKMIYYALGVFGLIFIVSLCFIENKIRNKWWIGLIPFYNIWCLSEDIFSNHWYSLLLLIPIANAIYMYVLIYNIGSSFSKKEEFKIFSIVFPNVMLPILAFDDSKYIKIKN